MSARHATALAQQAVELEHMCSEHAEAFEAALTASGRADALAMQLEQQHIAQQHQLAEAAAAAASAQLAEFERIRGAEHTKALAELQQQQMQERESAAVARTTLCCEHSNELAALRTKSDAEMANCTTVFEQQIEAAQQAEATAVAHLATAEESLRHITQNFAHYKRESDIAALADRIVSHAAHTATMNKAAMKFEKNAAQLRTTSETEQALVLKAQREELDMQIQRADQAKKWPKKRCLSAQHNQQLKRVCKQLNLSRPLPKSASKWRQLRLKVNDCKRYSQKLQHLQAS